MVFMDHKRLFPMAGPVSRTQEVIPFGQARMLRPGRDLTITCHSFMTVPTLAAASALADKGIEAEVLDLRSLAPLDTAAIIASIRRTGRLLTVEEGQVTCGVGAEVAFRAREALPTLRVARLGALPVPISSNPVLEAASLPDLARIIAAAQKLFA